MNKVTEQFDTLNVEVEETYVVDYKVAPGVYLDMGDGDEWPLIMKKVMDADILIVGTPIQIGEKSSVATLAMERLYASSGEKYEKGQAIYYNKVGGAAITGNEDGAKNQPSRSYMGYHTLGTRFLLTLTHTGLAKLDWDLLTQIRNKTTHLRFETQKCQPIISIIFPVY